jgi:hypothetical protein
LIVFIAFFWIFACVIVGVAANTRGRFGLGWFLLACIISPLLAGLLVLAMRRLDTATDGGAIVISGESQPQKLSILVSIVTATVIVFCGLAILGYLLNAGK